jgi:hypothetical protein
MTTFFNSAERSNPADFFFYRILNTEDGGSGAGGLDLGNKNEVASERISRLLDAWTVAPESQQVQHSIKTAIKGGIPESVYKTRAKAWTQFEYLLRRESRDSLRNPLVLKTKLMQTLFISLVLGLLYLNRNVTPTQQVQNQLGLLFFLAINSVL